MQCTSFLLCLQGNSESSPSTPAVVETPSFDDPALQANVNTVAKYFAIFNSPGDEESMLTFVARSYAEDVVSTNTFLNKVFHKPDIPGTFRWIWKLGGHARDLTFKTLTPDALVYEIILYYPATGTSMYRVSSTFSSPGVFRTITWFRVWHKPA